MRNFLLFMLGAVGGFAAASAVRQRKAPLSPDEWLLERVRTEVRIRTTHPDLIAVSAKDGRVELKGPILLDEIARLLVAVRTIPGVDRIDDDLEAFRRDERHPALD